MDEQTKKTEEIERILGFRNPTFWQKRQTDYEYKLRRPAKRFLIECRTFNRKRPMTASVTSKEFSEQVKDNVYESNKSLLKELVQTCKENPIIGALIVAGIFAVTGLVGGLIYKLGAWIIAFI